MPPTPGERFLPYTVDVPQALNVLAKHLFHDPQQFIRELVSNALDAIATGADPTAPILVTLRRSHGEWLLRIADRGSGMSRLTIETVLPTFFATTKRDGGIGQIGQFGIGLYSALQHADRVEVFSRCSEESTGTMVTLKAASNGIVIHDCEHELGTEVVVHLSRAAPPVLRKKDALRTYLSSVFALSPVDIVVDKDVVAGPSRATPPWVTKQSDESDVTRWQTLPGPKGTPFQHVDVVYVIRHSDESCDIALFLAKASIKEAARDLRLYCRRVFVESISLTPDVTPLSTCVRAIVNGSELPLTLDRRHVLVTDPAYTAVISTLLRTFAAGILAFREQDPSAAASYLFEHRTALLQLGVAHPQECQDILMLVPLKNISGQWRSVEDIAAANKNVIYYAMEGSAPSAKEVGDSMAQLTLLFTGELEVRACRQLLRGNAARLTWRASIREDSAGKIDHLSKIATSMLLEALAAPRPARKSSVAGNLMPRTLAAADVVETGSDAAWLEPVQNQGTDLAHAWEKALAANPGERADSVAVQRMLHYNAYHPVLRLNREHEVVRWMFKLRDSGKAEDASLAKVIFDLLLSSAIHASARKWYIYWWDFDDAAAAMISACEYLLLLHTEASDAKSP